MIVSSIVIFCNAQSQVDVDKLFHANPPSLAPNRAPNAQRPQLAQAQSIDSTNPVSDFEDELKPYRGSRHDEFDWALTKVFQKNLVFLTNNDMISTSNNFLESFGCQ